MVFHLKIYQRNVFNCSPGRRPGQPPDSGGLLFMSRLVYSGRIICKNFNVFFFAINFNKSKGCFKFINYSAYFCQKRASLMKRVTFFSGWFILWIFSGGWKIIIIPGLHCRILVLIFFSEISKNDCVLSCRTLDPNVFHILKRIRSA